MSWKMFLPEWKLGKMQLHILAEDRNLTFNNKLFCPLTWHLQTPIWNCKFSVTHIFKTHVQLQLRCSRDIKKKQNKTKHTCTKVAFFFCTLIRIYWKVYFLLLSAYQDTTAVHWDQKGTKKLFLKERSVKCFNTESKGKIYYTSPSKDSFPKRWKWNTIDKYFDYCSRNPC